MAQATQAQRHELESAARRFEQVNGELQTMLNTLMRELEDMKHKWQGAGGRSFESVKQAWSTDQANLNKNLLETAAGLNSAGQNYAVSDTEASQRLRAATRSGSTVLPL